MLLAEHGGAAGVRDMGLLESALARPRNRRAYDRRADVFALGAAYAYGLARNHPFVDGNKRVALVAAALFLELNGWSLEAPEVETAVIFEALAADATRETDLATWLQKHSRRRPP